MPPNSSIRIKPVSIHASVKDATYSIDSGLEVPPVSIHASVKDATAGRSVWKESCVFQSTHL